MHIAIDDTYGPEDGKISKYVTDARRTYVAVEFPDHQVAEIKKNIKSCLSSLPEFLGISVKEFHFTDIYNRRGAWEAVENGKNLKIFEFFADIYRHYNWRVHIQTVDERTLTDHNLKMSGLLDGINLNNKDGQALFFLLLKIKNSNRLKAEKLKLIIDSGNGKPGEKFAGKIFSEWGDNYEGSFEDSEKECLIQIADFLAYTINRCTYLQIKDSKKNIDKWFIDLVSSMSVQCDDLISVPINPSLGSLTDNMDAAHSRDRKRKGLE